MEKEYYKNSLKFKVLERIKRLRGNIVLRKDVADMASVRQISRCLKDLTDMNYLVRIGSGVYAKASKSEYADISVIKGSFDQACKETLTKLGVTWETGSAEQAYNAGLSTQVPVRTVVRLKSRCRRKLAYGKNVMVVEKKTNAR